MDKIIDSDERKCPGCGSKTLYRLQRSFMVNPYKDEEGEYHPKDTTFTCYNKECLKTYVTEPMITPSAPIPSRQKLKILEETEPYCKYGDVVAFNHDPTREYIIKSIYEIGTPAGMIVVSIDDMRARSFCFMCTDDTLYNPIAGWSKIRQATVEELNLLQTIWDSEYGDGYTSPSGFNVGQEVSTLQSKARHAKRNHSQR